MSVTLAITEAINRIEDLAVKARRMPLPERRRVKREIRRIIDSIEAQLDLLAEGAAGSKLTQEKFKFVEKQFASVAEILAEMRKALNVGTLNELLVLTPKLRERIRHLARMLTILQMPFAERLLGLELKPPRQLLFSSPLAAQIYNIVARRGEVYLDELVQELGADRSELSRALQALVQLGYVEILFDEAGRVKLRFAEGR